MPSPNTQSYSTILQNFAAAVQGASSKLLDFLIGSILRAIGQAMAGVALWLQGLILQQMARQRLATCTGDDVDTFCVDFMPALPNSVTATLPNGSPRLPAVSSSGQVTVGRYTPTNAAFIPAQTVFPIATNPPAGAVIQTADGTQTFVVIADTTNANYSATLGGYTIPAGTASINVAVQAINGGIQGNISAGTLTVLQTGISGVDTVINAAAYANGIDRESDPALKARFQAFFNSLSEGTVGAFTYAIMSLQQGLQSNIIENQDYNGTADNGMVTIIVDDGSGATPSPTLNAVFAAVNAVRAAGIRIGVFAASTLGANIVMNVHAATGYVAASVQAQVVAAVTAAVNATGLANTLDYMRLGQAGFDASPGAASITGVTLNGLQTDLVPTNKQTIKIASLTVNMV